MIMDQIDLSSEALGQYSRNKGTVHQAKTSFSQKTQDLIQSVQKSSNLISNIKYGQNLIGGA
jgi:hypothetical protein